MEKKVKYKIKNGKDRKWKRKKIKIKDTKLF
jgi:hypothetical protein